MRTSSIPGHPDAPRQPPQPELRKPAVVSQPRTYAMLKKGTNMMASAIRPTLGPLPRLVAMERLKRSEAPEFLDDGALIARRIIQVMPRGCDVGAMLLRNALWKMHQEMGDGSVTMGVMYQVALNEGIRYVTEFESNAMLLRNGLERGLQEVIRAIRRQSIPLSGKQNIANLALGMCQGNLEMADLFGEIFDIIGAEGMIVVENWNRPGMEREYVEGSYWDLSGWYSRLFLPNPAERTVFVEDAAILISDLEFNDPLQVVPVLEKCVKAGDKKLIILAKQVSSAVIGLLVNNNRAKTIETIAVRTPRISLEHRTDAMQDIQALTGGKIFFSAAGESLDSFEAEHLGHARRVWASESQFGIYGGKGDPRQVRKHLASVQNLIRNAVTDVEKEDVQKRIGRLLGGTAILRLGGYTDAEKTNRKEVGLRAVTGIRNALRGGVIAGGGAGLVDAQSALKDLSPQNEEEGFAFKILERALEEPMRTIAQNAGYSPDVILDRVRSAPPGYGLDARTGKIVDMIPAGIYDSAVVTEKALSVAISGAAMALTTDVIVHHKQPKESLEP